MIISAIKMKTGRIFTATTHCQAYTKAEEVGETADNVADWGFIEDGTWMSHAEATSSSHLWELRGLCRM